MTFIDRIRSKKRRTRANQTGRATRHRLFVEKLEDRITPTVSIVNSFAGLASGGPPDTVGAAGPNSYVETVNTAVSIYNKSTGATIATDGLNHFLFTVGGITPKGGLNDASMCYDEVTGQYIVADSDLNTSTNASALDIAVSKTSNPTTLDGSSWTFYQIVTTEAHESQDYEGNFGFNADAFVFTFNMFNTGGGNNHVEVTALSQSSLAAEGNVGGLQFDVSGFSMRPTTMHDSASGGPMWLVSEGGGNDSINLTRIDNILTAPSVHTFNLGVNAYNNVNPPLNPNGTVITTDIDNRILKAAEANNTIVACQHIGVGSTEDDARWYEFNVSNINSPFVANQGNVGFGSGTYTTYPSIDINAAGDIGLGASFSGTNFSTEYMSAFVTGMNPSDGGSMEGSFYIANGNSNNTDGRMGDFSGINVDPNGSFWTAQEITLGGSGATTIANFALSNNGEAFVKNGGLEVTGSNANDSFTLKPNPGNFGQTEVLNNGIDLGDFNNGSFSSINVFGFGGNDSLTLADTGGSSGLDFFNGVAVTYDGGSGTNSVLLDDSTAPFSDTYTVTSNTVSRPFFGGLTYSNVQNLTLNAETGNNTINIHSTSAPVTINDDAGSDTVNVGDPGMANGLDNLPGAVTVNGSGSDHVNVNDQDAVFSDTYNITSSTLTRIIFGGLTYSGLAGLTLNAETGNNTINIHSTSAPLTINDDAGSDTVNVGDPGMVNGLDNLPGAVTVHGSGSDFVNVNDQDAGFSDTYNITSTTLTRPFFGGLTYSGIAGLTLNAETGNNTITLVSTASSTPVTINGDGGTDTLVGPNVANTWTITGSNAGTVGNVTFTGIANLTGGTSTDGFKFPNGGSVSGVVNGGGGTNGIGYGLRTTGVTVNLTTGTATGTGGVTNIQNVTGSPANDNITGNSASNVINGNGGTDVLKGGGGGSDVFMLGATQGSGTTVTGAGTTDTLLGANIANTWTITGANAGNVNGIAFTGIANLTGGTSTDGFKFPNGGSVSGVVNGGGGTNGIGYGLRTTGVTVNLTTGTATGTGGVTNIQNVTGSPANDTIIGNAASNVINGNGGTDVLKGGGGGSDLFMLGATQGSGTTVTGAGTTDTILGANIANTWTITGANAGNVNGIAFTGIANLTGGTLNDLFKFTAGSVSGKVNGGTGTDTLDYSGDGGIPVTVNLATGAATKTGGFLAIEKLVGSSSTADTLIGPNATNVWSITGVNAGTVGTFAFSAVENLTGGTGEDEFVFSAGKTISGKIDGGGGGTDWLDYAAYTTAVTVNLTTLTATGIGGGIARIRNVRGGQGGTTLTGNASGNILIGGAGTNTIVGGSGRSILIGGKGKDTVTGNSGSDILIAGYTDYDTSSTAHDLALEAIFNEWQSADSYSTRISKIKAGVGSGSKFVWGTTVHDNSTSNANTLTGSGGSTGTNWFFANLSHTTTNKTATEQLN